MDMVYIVIYNDIYEDCRIIDKVFLNIEDAIEYCSIMNKKAAFGTIYVYESYPLC